MVRKYITIDINNISKYSDLVCKYRFKKGNSLGDVCYVRNYCDGYCLKHFKLVQKYESKRNTPRCQYETINGRCRRKTLESITCNYHKLNKKEDLFLESIPKKVKINNLICYYNDYKDKKQIDNIIIKDNILINNRSIPLLLCYNNDNTLFKGYLSKLRKRLKKKNYKNKRKMEKKKINSNIKIEYFNEGKDILGFSISNKRKSPFPNEEIIIDNILYKNSYYEWKPVKKEAILYCINIEKNIKKIFIYSLDQFEEMLHNIYTKETVSRYFGW
jgi:hypothetical protein